MPRRAARVDHNQAAIVRALRAAGASVQSLAALGKGCPDLLAGVMDEATGERRNVLLEVKNPNVPTSDQALTPAEERWEENWAGQYTVVRTIDEALRAIGVLHQRTWSIEEEPWGE